MVSSFGFTNSFIYAGANGKHQHFSVVFIVFQYFNILFINFTPH